MFNIIYWSTIEGKTQMMKREKKTRNMFRLSKAADTLSSAISLKYKVSRPDLVALAIDTVEQGHIDICTIPSIEDASNGHLTKLVVVGLDKYHNQKLKELADISGISKSEVIRRLIGLIYNFG